MDATFNLSELVVPGTYIRVDAEGLVGAPAVSTGNIGIVGTANSGTGNTSLLSSYADATRLYGAYDPFASGAGHLNLPRALEILYRNGAGSVFARAVAPAADTAAFTAAFTELLKDDVNLLVAPELSTDDALSVLGGVVADAEQHHFKDLMAIVGSDVDPDTDPAFLASIAAQAPTNERIVLVAPGILAHDAADTSTRDEIRLPGTYAAAAVAGLISTLAPQSSPTNKFLPGIVHLAHRFTYAEQEQLIKARVLALEQRGGVRVVRGVTTDDPSGPFRQITTRRIVDYAKAGIRGVSNPFIGRLNNQRVRKALQGAIDGFLTSMLVDEALTAYQLSVTATRQDEIAGRAIVNAVLQPTFSIDFVAVTLVLQ